MNARVQNHVTGRLSLRPPQAESLAKLVQALEAAPSLLGHEQDLAAILNTLKAEFPTLTDFEREFPSLCFALATGVGKTRLMGAFIAYLHLAHGINNFFVLAPNLTIYNKLIADFTRNTPKYVFKGIAEFAQQPPLIITGDNYDQSGAAVDAQSMGFAQDVRINIFNISKINSEVRGGKEPRIKRMKEVLGDSYFNHLANLPDLVLLMDESHRYRASAGVRSINELQPLFGLELTATPFVEAKPRPLPFKNVVMDYPLARAVVTQRNFDANAHTLEETEKIKLEDGVRLHESTKVELLTYARENGVKTVKPFMLVIARDTTHASELKTLIESSVFYNGRYAHKVIQVDSSRTGAEEEEMIARLLSVESVDEPTEIVIHVNMLKEGWDVTNLYTIVPLRAAHARTLIEQSIGRGLRLPYGKRTGVAAVDRLNIVAHDKFQELIDEANRGDSPIRLKQLILDAPSAEDDKLSVQISSSAAVRLGLSSTPEVASAPTQTVTAHAQPAPPVFTTERELQAAHLVMQVISTYEVKRELVPTSSALLKADVQSAILAEVTERLASAASTLQPAQASLLTPLLTDADDAKPAFDLSAVVAKTTEILVQQSIDIPRITVIPSGEVTTGFHPFKLGALPNFQPGKREIVGQELRTNEQFTLNREAGSKEQRYEDYIVKKLVDFDDIDYLTQASLLYELAGQAVTHYQAQNYSDSELHEIFDTYGFELARLIRAEMMAHFWQRATRYEVEISRGFTELKLSSYTANAHQTARHFRETVTEPGKIKQMLFGGFTRCLCDLQKFDSDTERRFAVILERDASKWFKPAKGQFAIYYKLGTEQPEYIPDFVAESDSTIFMVETKARSDITDQEVQAKATAAASWCQHASKYAATVGSKPWTYLLIPHDEVAESKRLSDFLRFAVKC
ncbi:MAG: DEAD/DEAH box helicase family protein [Pseudomonadota bacterium]